MFAQRSLMVVMTAGQLALVCGQTFNKRYDLFNQNYPQAAWDIEPVGNGDFAIVAGTNTEDSLNLYLTVALLRINSDGAVLSESTMIYGLNSLYAGWANAAGLNDQGDIVIGGSIRLDQGLARPTIFTFSATGDSLWFREYGDDVEEWLGRQALQTKDGGYLLCGETTVATTVDAFLLKTDTAGNEEWRRTFGWPIYRDFAATVDTTADQGYFVGGASERSPNDFDMWVMRLTSNGDTLWSKRWGSVFAETNAHLTTKSNGNPVLAGLWGYGADYILTRAYMAELSATDGSFVWQREYGPVSYDNVLLTGKEIAPGQGHIAAGFTYDMLGAGKGLLLRTADNGDSLWMRDYFYYDSLLVDGTGQFKDVITTPDGGYIACGVVFFSASGNNPPGYNQDVWVVKVDSLGCIIPGCDDFTTAITSQVTNLRDALSVYPNPARDQTTVKVTLPLSSPFVKDLRLRLVSAEGQEVLDGGAVVGENTVEVGKLAAGVYYIHLTSGSTWLSGTKLIIE